MPEGFPQQDSTPDFTPGSGEELLALLSDPEFDRVWNDPKTYEGAMDALDAARDELIRNGGYYEPY